MFKRPETQHLIVIDVKSINIKIIIIQVKNVMLIKMKKKRGWYDLKRERMRSVNLFYLFVY